jgi:hypothetical protein
MKLTLTTLVAIVLATSAFAGSGHSKKADVPYAYSNAYGVGPANDSR